METIETKENAPATPAEPDTQPSVLKSVLLRILLILALLSVGTKNLSAVQPSSSRFSPALVEDKKHKGGVGPFRVPRRLCASLLARLETERRAEFTPEGAWHDRARRRQESLRSSKRIRADAGDKVLSEVRSVGQIKCLKEEIQSPLLAEFDRLADAGVELEERLSAGAAEANLLAASIGEAGAQLGRSHVF